MLKVAKDLIRWSKLHENGFWLKYQEKTAIAKNDSATEPIICEEGRFFIA